MLRGVFRSSWLIRANPVLISLVNGSITVLMLSATVIAVWKPDCMAASFTNLVRGFINTLLQRIQHQCNCLYSAMRRNRSTGIEVQRWWNGESHRQQLIDASSISIVQALQIRAILRERCRFSLQQQERWRLGHANSNAIRKTKFTRVVLVSRDTGFLQVRIECQQNNFRSSRFTLAFKRCCFTAPMLFSIAQFDF